MTTTIRTEELRRLADEVDERWPQIAAHNLKLGVPLPTLYALLDELDQLREGIRILRENWPKTVPAPMDSQR